MKKIWEFFENMNELVYVSDMETHDIVYMNRKAKKMYGIKDVAELKGKKCYELFQQSSSPCAICTNQKLKVGSFEEWEYFNPVLGKSFLLKDTMIKEDGKYYRLELAVEIIIQELHGNSVRQYINNESIINEALRISLSTSLPSKSFEILLEYIGKALRCERIYIFEEKQGKVFDNTYEWCANGVTPQIDNLQNIPREDTALWLERFQNNRNVIIQNLEDIRETDPVMYDYLFPQNIQSLVVSPLVYKDRIIGFYGVDNPPKELLQNISTLFLILGHFIVSLIRRRDLIKRLERLSFYDQLTGFGNRHAMEAFIAGMEQNNSIGVVYCDVMGLKRVNDLHGHQAGDDLLLRACECLNQTFSTYSLFRIGGDEFVVLCAGISEERLAGKTEQLREEMVKNSALMAIGYVWRRNSMDDVNRLLIEADEQMYKDKRRYYAQNNKIRPRRETYSFSADAAKNEKV